VLKKQNQIFIKYLLQPETSLIDSALRFPKRVETKKRADILQ
jgi:hypothetical protein